MIANMPAELIARSRLVLPGDRLIEITFWRVPTPVPPSTHHFKYSAVYVRRGERIVGFDNERGKGDHCHIFGIEAAYTFTSLAQLELDFLAAVEKARSTE